MAQLIGVTKYSRGQTGRWSPRKVWLYSATKEMWDLVQVISLNFFFYKMGSKAPSYFPSLRTDIKTKWDNRYKSSSWSIKCHLCNWSLISVSETVPIYSRSFIKLYLEIEMSLSLTWWMKKKIPQGYHVKFYLIHWISPNCLPWAPKILSTYQCFH